MVGLIIFLIVYIFVILPLMILGGIAIACVALRYALYRIAEQTDACAPKRAWIFALLNVSFFKPRAQKVSAQEADFEMCDGAAAIPAKALAKG